jgi:hypothetical protein
VFLISTISFCVITKLSDNPVKSLDMSKTLKYYMAILGECSIYQGSIVVLDTYNGKKEQDNPWI